MSIFHLLYLLAAALFILALKWMSAPATARRGVISGELVCCWQWWAPCCGMRL